MERSRGAGQPPKPRLSGAGFSSAGAQGPPGQNARNFWMEYFSPNGPYSSWDGYAPQDKLESENWGEAEQELSNDIAPMLGATMKAGEYSEKDKQVIKDQFAEIRKKYKIDEAMDRPVAKWPPVAAKDQRPRGNQEIHCKEPGCDDWVYLNDIISGESGWSTEGPYCPKHSREHGVSADESVATRDLAYEEEFVTWFMNKMNALGPEEREDRLGYSDEFDYAMSQNWIHNLLDNEALRREKRSYQAFKRRHKENASDEAIEAAIDKLLKE